MGKNQQAARLFGIQPNLVGLTAMMLGGGLAGLAGCLQVTAVYHRLIPSISSGYGYLGLLIVMLAGYRAAAVPFIALFFAAGIAATSAPLVFAALGETLTEKAGVINLSPDGTILLAAMTGIPSHIFQVAPFPLMIFTLVLIHLSRNVRNTGGSRLLALLSGTLPLALGRTYRQD